MIFIDTLIIIKNIILRIMVQEHHDGVTIMADIDEDCRYYFDHLCGNQYVLRLPNVLRRTTFSIVTYSEFSNDNFKKTFFTVTELFALINVLWGIPDGNYTERSWLQQVNTNMRKRIFDTKDHQKKCSATIAKMLIEKGIISSAKSIKTWYEHDQSENGRKKLTDMFATNISDDNDCLGLRIAINQKSVATFIMY